tara:strand:+ start:448 stop:654 length:207 start_codon:yes stop_codon:yes gene_type:complete
MDKNRLSPWEAKKNLTELAEKIGDEHAREVENKISEAIYEQIYFEFGETLHQETEYCSFCDSFECICC